MAEQTSQQQLNEALSAVMDGEATELELRRVLKSEGAELGDRWHRYQLASAAMRGDVQLSAPIDLSASISAAIAEEEAYSVETSGKNEASSSETSKRGVWSNFGRFGIAASMAAAVIAGVQFTSFNTGLNVADVSENQNISAPASGNLVLDGNTSVQVVRQEDKPLPVQQNEIVINQDTQQKASRTQDEVKRLMREHAQDGSQNTQNGVSSFTRVPDSEQ